MKLRMILLLLMSVVCMISNGQVPPHLTVGDYEIFADPANYGTAYELDENRINLVFLAEGYTGDLVDPAITYNDYPYFEAYKDAVINTMFGSESVGNPWTLPLNRYRDYFNIYWVWVNSTGSGAGCKSYPSCGHSPCYQTVDNNYWGSIYDWSPPASPGGGSFHRLLYPEDYEQEAHKVQDDVFNNTTAPLQIVVCVNPTWPFPATMPPFHTIFRPIKKIIT